MVQIVGYNAIGAGLIVDIDQTEETAQYLDAPIDVTQTQKTDQGDGSFLFRFAATGDPNIVAGSVIAHKNKDGYFVDKIIYRDADGAAVVVIKLVKDAIPVSADGFAASVMNFVAAAQVSLAGHDTLSGKSFDDELRGLSGNDKLFGFGGQDLLIGGDGDDILKGGEGGDQLIGGAGNDTASYAGAQSRVVVSLLDLSSNKGEAAGDTYSSIETISGTTFNDHLAGNNAANRFFGGNGDDTLNGAGGDDYLNGGNGNDTINGGAGADTIYAGAGDDIIFVTDFWDQVDGGDGWDTLNLSKLSQGVSVSNAADDTGGDGGSDTTSFTNIEAYVGTDYGDSFELGNRASEIRSGRGHDDIYLPGTGDDYVESGGGDDRIYTGYGSDTVYGNGGDDEIYMTANSRKDSNTAYGHDGDDYISTSGTDDYISGGGNDDILVARSNSDFDLSTSARLSGGSGNDTLVNFGSDACDMYGDSGYDAFYFDEFGTSVVHDFNRYDDVLVFDSSLWSDAQKSASNAAQVLVLNNAQVIGSDTVIELNSASGDPFKITIEDFTDLYGLAQLIYFA